MLVYLKKIIFAIIVMLILLSSCVFAENISIKFVYGINNIAKDRNHLPIELRIENKDSKKFYGNAKISIFENNDSVYVYNFNVHILEKDLTIINENISISNKSNAIVIEIYNNKQELVIIERTNIDLSYYDDKLFIGAISSNFNKLSYINNISLHNNIIKTMLVEITEDMFLRNKNVLDQLDMLLISDVDLNNFGDSFNYAINQFIHNGKIVIIGLGGKNGIYSMPSELYSYLSGPTFDLEEKFNKNMNINITHFSFTNGKKLLDTSTQFNIEVLNLNDSIVICSPFSFNDLNEYSNNYKVFSNVIEKSLGDKLLNDIFINFNLLKNNDYYDISNLLNMINKTKLPDISALTILLAIYLFGMILVIYVYLRNINRRDLYGRVVFVFSLVFTFIMLYYGSRIMKKNTFLTYFSIVDVKENSTNEKAFLNFRTSESGSYTFNTSANNKIYPMLKSSNEPIISMNFINANTIKKTSFLKKNNRMNIDVVNAKDFDSNIFTYENNNYLNDVYNIDCELIRFDGKVSGHITNKMNLRIRDASVLMFGKIVKIGDIDANRSVLLSGLENLGVPIGNNLMLSEILANQNNQNIIKYYLDENINEYFNYAILFGFIDNNGTIDINSNDVGDVYGRTLIARKIIINNNNNNIVDVCSFENEVNNISGYYDYNNNSTDGKSEVVNEYYFDKVKKITQIYFEPISNYDRGSISFNVPFYGDIYILNLDTKSYDVLNGNRISNSNLNRYLNVDGKIIIKYVPFSIDPLYRKISLPILRALRNDN